MSDFVKGMKKALVGSFAAMAALNPALGMALQDTCARGGGQSKDDLGEACAVQVGLKEGVVSTLAPIADSALWIAGRAAKAVGVSFNDKDGPLSGEYVEPGLIAQTQKSYGYNPKTATPAQESLRSSVATGTEVVAIGASLVAPPLLAGKLGLAFDAFEIGAPMAKGLVKGMTKVAEEPQAAPTRQMARTEPAPEPIRN